MTGPPAFADRRDAGRRLAAACAGRVAAPATVVGLARGGVPVAAEVAAALGAPLDALVVRKVGHPAQPELALGAVTASGAGHRNPLPRRLLPAFEEGREAALREAVALEERLRAHVAPVPVAGRACVLVDDGLATGATMRAGIAWARRAGARSVVVAVPVAAAPTAREIRDEVDEVVCPVETEDLRAVGHWYRDFSQVTDAEVAAILRAARAGAGGGPAAP